MDKNEQNLKIEELKAAMHNHDFDKAVEIADSIDLKKVRDNIFLSLVADAYELTHNYQEAKDVLLLAYENTNAGRQLAYRLCLIAIKTKEYDEAQEFYEDFVDMAPRDTARYVLKYKMAKAQNKPIEKLIGILEEYVNIDMEEKWAYELAKLYHMAGDEERCVDMCDEISLWFAEGKYVIKAMDLKKMYRPLTPAQQKHYDEGKKKNMEEAARIEAEKISESLKPFETQPESEPEVPEIEIKNVDDDKFNTIEIQAVVADGMKEVEIKEEENIHEDEGATKVAPDFETPEINETIPVDEGMEEITSKIEEAPINDIKGVEDILRKLQERGILKAETVEQAVNIIDETANAKDEEEAEVDGQIELDIPEVDEEQEPVNEFVEASTIEIPEVNVEELEVKVEIPEVKVEEPVQEVSKDGIPVFDLSFEATNTVAVDEKKEPVKEETQEPLKSTKNLSAKVEVLSGTDWIQPEAPKKEEAYVEEKVIKETEEPGIRLTEEDLVAFKNYLNVEGLETNIREVVEAMINNYTPNGKSTDGNVIIMGSEKTGKTTLAIELIKLVNNKRGRRNRKLVKVDAVALNKRGFRKSLNKLLGSDLIIENAHQLGAMTISEIVDVSGMFTDDMLIVLEGETEGMENLLIESARLSDVFNHLIRIKEYDIKEWVEYGIRYAKEKDYTLDELANLAFYKAIDDYFGANKGIGQSDVEKIIDEAIDKSKGIKRKLSGIFSSKKDDDGLYILVESDFNI